MILTFFFRDSYEENIFDQELSSKIKDVKIQDPEIDHRSLKYFNSYHQIISIDKSKNVPEGEKFNNYVDNYFDAINGILTPVEKVKR